MANYNIKKQTVIYHVKIEGWNEGAWYKDMKGKTFDCVLDIDDTPFGGRSVVFKVLHCYSPIKYIQPHHCKIKGQKTATNLEVIQYYGKSNNNS